MISDDLESRPLALGRPNSRPKNSPAGPMIFDDLFVCHTPAARAVARFYAGFGRPNTPACFR